MPCRRVFLALAVAACLSAPPAVSAQRGKDDPEPVIRAMVLAMYSNDVVAYDKVTLPHPLKSRLTSGGRVNESALQELKENPGALQIREQREKLFHGKPATLGPTGRYPTGTTALYRVSHRNSMVVPLVRRDDGWKVDVRWWIAMMEMMTGPPPAAGSPDRAIRSMLAAMLRLDRAGAGKFLTDGRNLDALFADAPRYREPSGVLDATVEEMPLVEIEPGEFYPVPVGPPIEGTREPDRKVLVGLFGPVEMPFVLRKMGSDWRVVAQPYFVLMNR
jgi:hypothetical protein